jgi:membrane-bound lytic murein transglycosylase B
MESLKFFRTALVATGVLLVAACASQPASQPAPAAASAPAAKAAPAASAAPAAAAASPEAKPEADAAAALEKKFQEAARSYRAVQKDGKTLYCKKERPINSTIPRVQCITESQLRLQVEQMDEMRDGLRNSSRCTMGAGCGGGG